MTELFQFDAFISYNRADSAFAGQLEKTLENWSIPRGVRPDQSRLKVFRDTDDMTGTDYHKAICRHLDASRKLILICSPNARGSTFVNEEVAYFIEGHSPESVIPVLLSGIANNEGGEAEDYAFPEALVEAMGMPLAVDYRAWRKGSPRARPFRNPWYSMLAELLDISRDEIEERDRRYRLARQRRYGAIAAAVVLTTGVLAHRWWSERGERQAAQRISEAQEILQTAMSVQDRRERALELSRLVEYPEVDGALEAALATGMDISRTGGVGDPPGDIAAAYWRDRVPGVPSDNIRPLAAASVQPDCAFSLPPHETVSGLVTPDGSTEAFLHDGRLFIQNSDGLGAALVYCLGSSEWVDNSPGSLDWREGTETLTGRMAFGNSGGPHVQVKNLNSFSLFRVSLVRPGKHVILLRNIDHAEFGDDNRLQFTVRGLPAQTLRLAAGEGAANAIPAPRCFSYRGEEKRISAILESEGFHGYPDPVNYPFTELRGCIIDSGKVLAYVTEGGMALGYSDVLAAWDTGTKGQLLLDYTFSAGCTVFASKSLSYCGAGDYSVGEITRAPIFREFGETQEAHEIESAFWSPELSGAALLSPDHSRIALWATMGGDFPAQRSVAIWLEDRPAPRWIVLDRTESPVREAAFSPDSRYLMVLREDGTLKVWSFDTGKLLESLASRYYPVF